MQERHAGSGQFHTTRWSVVVQAGGEGAQASEALAFLCSTYWYPLYYFARRRGLDMHTAQDSVQGFLAKAVEGNLFAAADRDKGRVRTFLLTAFKRYIKDQRAMRSAQKRGGGHVPISIDAAWAEHWIGVEPVDNRTPDQSYDHQWALAIVHSAWAHLADEWDAKGKRPLFDLLRSSITQDEEETTYREIAQAQGMTEGAVKAAAHRLRGNFRDRIRAQVRETVCAEEDIEDELGYLLEALQS